MHGDTRRRWRATLPDHDLALATLWRLIARGELRTDLSVPITFHSILYPRDRNITHRLRSMTFEHLQPVYRGDEDPARFAGRRYDTRVPDSRAYRFAVCGRCLEGDSVPYLRSLWHVGWLAVCPIHGTVLLIRCERCHCGIRVPQLSLCAPFSPTTCTRCGESLLSQRYRTARPEVVRLQDALLKGKREGTTEIA